jgi:hypothetical protein
LETAFNKMIEKLAISKNEIKKINILPEDEVEKQ